MYHQQICYLCPNTIWHGNSSKENLGTGLGDAKKNIHSVCSPRPKFCICGYQLLLNVLCRSANKAILSGDAFRPMICERKQLSEEGGMIFFVPLVTDNDSEDERLLSSFLLCLIM